MSLQKWMAAKQIEKDCQDTRGFNFEQRIDFEQRVDRDHHSIVTALKRSRTCRE
jgi:hypothetical protein